MQVINNCIRVTVANYILIIVHVAWTDVLVLCKPMNTKRAALRKEQLGRVAGALLRARILDHTFLENK